LRVEVDRPDVGDLIVDTTPAPDRAESTAGMAKRVAAARRMAGTRGVHCNAELAGPALDRLAPMESGARRLLEVRLRQGRLSARGLHRVRRVARTLADLDGRAGLVTVDDVYGALALRTEVFMTEEVLP
jgi:magnesium chelatase family protein